MESHKGSKLGGTQCGTSEHDGDPRGLKRQWRPQTNNTGDTPLSRNILQQACLNGGGKRDYGNESSKIPGAANQKKSKSIALQGEKCRRPRNAFLSRDHRGSVYRGKDVFPVEVRETGGREDLCSNN